ncbi:MAG: hypothetical protein JWQ40_2149 [Segetibacter sp.]|nr:hypothetical protein [Segetibacter sp.]
MKPVILLVDDNSEILEFIADFLDEKYTTVKALNGHEALQVLQQDLFNLLSAIL